MTAFSARARVIKTSPSVCGKDWAALFKTKHGTHELDGCICHPLSSYLTNIIKTFLLVIE